MASFPDLPHLKQLLSDLWQWPKSRAAVMVGAGFSLNAEPLPGVRKRFPTWRELVRSMFDQLHPSRPDEPPEEREVCFNRASPLRIASEFEAAFGPRKLEHLIRSENPDSDYRPGSLHRQLLQLPWADVFTTNYDTLLERTEVDGRTYQPVIKVGELTTAFAPRIVKLHGSFPSQTPFIITEEDYRTYPRDFAPFVNSVQQSLLENSFVLIGFSGDDPNFLEWTGWIRDELGENHAPIYLVGALCLSDPERSLLVRRGVTPIDLTPLCEDAHGPGELHAVATERFLKILAAGRPPRPEKWPDLGLSATGIHPNITGLGPDIPERVGLAPKVPKLTPEMFADLLKRWRFERSAYPGWIVAPEAKRLELWTKTKYWITPLLDFVKGLFAVDRLLMIGEINWRIEVAMAPLFADWVEPFEKALDELLEDMANGRSPQPSAALRVAGHAGDSQIADAWFEVAFSLLRDARESYDAARWTATKAKIDRVVRQHQRQWDRDQYEKALWAAWNVNREAARTILSEWHTPQSPIAQMWKAGLLAELDEKAEARTTLRAALAEIRRSLRNQGQSRELLSLEGWCTYLIVAVELSLDFLHSPDPRDEFWERWEELKAWDCSPWPYKEYFDEVLSAPPPEIPKQVEEVRGFDPGEVTRSVHFGGDLDPFLPGFACIRLFEQVGIPLRLPMTGSIGELNLVGECLKNACRWVAPFTGFWSPALLIRAARLDDLTKSEFLTRTQVAAMDAALAKRIHSWCFEILVREIAPVSGLMSRIPSQVPLLQVCAEVLSRLAFRLDATELRSSFTIALQYLRLPVARADMGMHKACMKWFERLFEAADSELLLEWLPELIRQPLPEDGFHPALQTQYAWPDPIRNYPFDRVQGLAESHPDLISKVSDATAWLLRRAASESGLLRRWTVLRLILVHGGNWMSADQQRQLGEVLWSSRSLNGLPDIPGLAIPPLLNLPSPADVDVASIVKSYILNLTTAGAVTRNAKGGISVASGGPPLPLLSDAAYTSEAPLRLGAELRGGIEWTQDEARQLFHRALAWWDNDKAAFELKDTIFPTADSVLQNLRLMSPFLIRVVLPRIDSADEVEWQKLVAVLSDARKFGVYLTEVLPYMLLRRPGDAETATKAITDDLYSDVKGAVCAAAGAVRHWVNLSAAGRVPPPSDTLLTRIIERVIFRRDPGVSSCLSNLAFLIAEKPDAVDAQQTALLTASMVPWHRATMLPFRDAVSGEFAEVERPDLQVRVAMLAGALSLWRRRFASETPEPAALALWRDLCASSPLPEVRRAFGFAIGPDWKERDQSASHPTACQGGT